MNNLNYLHLGAGILIAIVLLYAAVKVAQCFGKSDQEKEDDRELDIAP